MSIVDFFKNLFRDEEKRSAGRGTAQTESN